MKFVCKKKNLSDGLVIATKVISGGNTLPILNNILLKTDKGRLKISSTNLELAINTWVGGKIEEEGEITVPARLANDHINNLLADKLEISTEKQTLFVKGENAETHIKGLPAEEFPLIPEIGDALLAKIEGKELQRAIGEVGFAAAFSETQPEISGVLFNFEGKTLTLAATDRYRLAEAKVNLAEAAAASKQIIIPARAVNEISRSLGSGPVEVYLKEGQVCFRNLDTELISRLIEGQYPDYKQIIPQNYTTQAEIERVLFIQSLKAASVFATENYNIELELTPQTKHVVMKSQSAQAGDSEIHIPAEVSGQKNSIIFNYRYLLDCLNNLSDEKISLRMISPASPAAIVPAKREDFLYIVMPIKI
jgi:DNA polymerase-3 subunit beta